MLIVAAFNMITGLLILIIEKTNMIGILKTVGTANWSIRKVFLYNALFIITKGVIIGNVVGLGLAFLQQYTGLITLDPATYYVNVVPIEIKFLPWLWLNIGTIIITVVMMVIPSFLVTRISPVQAIRFE